MKVKVKFLTAISGLPNPAYDLGDHSFAPGDVVELHPDHAAALVAGGLAVYVQPDMGLPPPIGEQAKVKKPRKAKAVGDAVPDAAPGDSPASE